MIHGLLHIHALRKPNPRFAQVIHGLSGQSMDIADPRFAQDIPWMVPIHGLRRAYTAVRFATFLHQASCSSSDMRMRGQLLCNCT